MVLPTWESQLILFTNDLDYHRCRWDLKIIIIMKSIKKFWVGFLLVIASIIFVIPFIIWGLTESVISLFYKRKFFKAIGVFGSLLLLIATTVDVFINVVCKVPFDRLLREENGYEFGSRYDTISYALGRNEIDNTLSKKGKLVCRVLNKLDKNHCKNSVLNRQL